jgi:protein O-GlcNAc transferase
MKFVSFSLYGRNPWYTVGAIKNARLAEKVYPGWICRFYHDSTVPDEILQALAQISHVQLIYMHKSSDPKSTGMEHAGMFWRYYVAADPAVERWLVRDTDSRLNWREKACVDQWITSGLPFHIIREKGHKWNIMPGMCGGIGGLFPNIREEIEKYLRSRQPLWRLLTRRYTFPKWTDAKFLDEHIWPKIKNRHLAHDDNVPRLHATDLPFPPHKELEQGMGAFVGQVLDENDNPIDKDEFRPEIRGY